MSISKIERALTQLLTQLPEPASGQVHRFVFEGNSLTVIFNEDGSADYWWRSSGPCSRRTMDGGSLAVCRRRLLRSQAISR